MKTVYPAIFTQSDMWVLIEILDLGISTEGKDIFDAMNMARDAISLKLVCMEDKGEPIPTPSSIKDIDLSKSAFKDDGDSIVTLVDVDTTQYRRSIDKKAVRRNVTLPSWLNREADMAKLNVSKVLQEALIQKLDSMQD